MTARSSWWWSFVFAAAMALVLVGERAIGAGTSRYMVTGLGVAVALGVAAIRWLRARTADARTERMLLWLSAVGLFALAVYALQSDLCSRLWDKPLDQSSPRLFGLMASLWPAVLTCSLLPMLMVEVSYLGMARAPVIEAARIRDALFSGLGLSFALIFAFAATYVGTARDAKWDLSFARTAQPGDATRNVVRGLQEPLEVSLFFPPANDVKEQVQEYFDLLKGDSSMLRVTAYDQAVDIARAKELGVTNNGFVAFSRGQRKEVLSVGQKLESARSLLKNLDVEVQKKLIQVSRARRVIYFVSGHGERGEEIANPDQPRATIREYRTFLRSQNHELNDLTATQGLAADVPKNAAAVFIIGPTAKLMAEEAESIARYIRNGGRVMLALDPEAGLDFAELLPKLGLKYSPTTLASDSAYYPLRHQVSDRGIIYTSSYSSHPSVSTLSRLGRRAPILLMHAGSLSEVAATDRAKELSIDFSVHADGSTWSDLNGNFQFDPPAEARRSYELAAAVTYKPSKDAKPEQEGRLVVIGDSDFLADQLIRNEGPAYFALDSAKWLLGDESISGTVNAETDVAIQHTKNEDKAWFYSTVFLMPALVIGAGVVVTRRRGVRR